MVRMQITLDAQTHRRAKRRAAELGISLSELTRRALANDLGEPQAGGELSAIFGLGDSGGSDVARRKDEYLGEALAREHLRKTGRRG